MSDASGEKQNRGNVAGIDTQYLLVGAFDSPTVASIVSSIPNACCTNDTQTALKLVSQGQVDPSHLLFIQERPGQLSWKDASLLIDALPLTKVMTVLGGWCEGETRTGSPWPGVTRIYWHQLQDYLRQIDNPRFDLQEDGRGVCRTWTDADTSLASSRNVAGELDSTVTREGHRGMLAIRARERETFEAFAGWIEKLEYSSVWLTCSGPFTQIPVMTTLSGCLWFGDITRASEREDLRALSNRLSDVRLIALLHFPRQRDVQAAYDLGADHVVSLPCWGDGLTCALDSVFNAVGVESIARQS